MTDVGAAVALACLPGMGPATLDALLSDTGSPPAAWAAVREGRVRRPSSPGGGDRTPWAVAARRLDPEALAAHCARAGTSVTWPGRPDYPDRLAGDPQRPGVLFWRGSLEGLGRRCVAVVGTRRCTHDGRIVAGELGRDLAHAGVCVVSGLAAGIDGAAHRGALLAGWRGVTVGVAAGGVDVAYPRVHAELWEEVAARGAVLSEVPPGRQPQGWRFPVRNRVIAGLADLVVVVESPAGGGSFHTVEAALARGVDVRVVPGAVLSPASAGVNQLLVEGAGAVRDAVDVLDALGDVSGQRPVPSPTSRHRPRSGAAPAAPRSATPDGERLGPAAAAVLGAIGRRPVTLNTVLLASGLSVPAATAALDQLAERGYVVEERGWWQRA